MDRLRLWLEDSLPDRFQQLPHHLLGSDSPVHRRGKVWGDATYNFSLQFEPCSKHDGICQTGVLVAAASSKTSAQSIPLKCRWIRRIGAHSREIPGITGSMYHASADDVGVYIVCQAEPTSPDPEAQGVAYGQIGPFVLDPITRMSVEDLVTREGSRFPVRHFREAGDQRPRDLQIQVRPEGLKVVHPGPNNEVLAPYTADYPKVVLDPLDTCHFRLELSEDREKSYHFMALSRASRDLIVLLMRTFQARMYVATSYMLGRLSQNPSRPGVLSMANVNEDPSAAGFDIAKHAETLGKEMDRAAGQLEAVDKMVCSAHEERAQLQTQLQETISSYTEVIDKLHDQIAKAKGGPVASLQLQLQDAKALNAKLSTETRSLKQQLEEEQQTTSEAYGVEAEQLREEIAQLQASILWTVSSTQRDQTRDQTREQELRRLRQDVDELSKEKEGLERNVQQGEREKSELIENFLYVKGALDKLQIASLHMPEASPEVIGEVQSLKTSYSQTVDERNRLAVKVETMDRDREKEKAQREAALERVMATNARLMEERDRLLQEKVRISALYQSTMAAMGVDEASMAKAPDAGANGSGESVEGLQALLAGKVEELRKVEEEGDSLRSRLRKLAMV
eukprot:CAMPEP_0178465262 /NCGR_PEP_ID=MMETSP0689_2-20121128/51265_1 /TAXON_ID=160604 /ORGANISM="Amphidinium massartii, Strain CS-259" /LENGTH=623 /DNA_ID=CAMNT_0020092185 /DNA_START=105 /DNA_END=1977 /DNA_ORIENTATION=-